FFFSSRRRHTRFSRDWSSDVCSSDLMVFLCQKIQRQYGGAYTFVLVTDRVELNTQIYGTFAGVGAVTNKKAKAGSGKDLKELLGDRKSVVEGKSGGRGWRRSRAKRDS